tara:strand:- start:220 stop:573 length:354 start_codon:yes stop_codon:yes gene_type:complete
MDIHNAIVSLRPKSSFVQRGPDYSGLEWADGNSEGKPTESEILAEIVRLQEAEPIRLLRIDRDKLLASSDWTGLSDVDMTSEKLAEWKLYRQKLRDLPSGLDTVGKVKAVTWPEKPE